MKATFFFVGRHAEANPEAARLVYAAGHTVANHSQSHSLQFDQLDNNKVAQEIEKGVTSIKAAIGADAVVAPFFRVPGLNRTRAIERYAESRELSVWSSDTVADDWTPIGADDVLNRALNRLEAKGGGVLLLHDIQARTVIMLPQLLTRLKERGFRIVHVVPASPNARQPIPVQELIAIADLAPRPAWPRVLD